MSRPVRIRAKKMVAASPATKVASGKEASARKPRRGATHADSQMQPARSTRDAPATVIGAPRTIAEFMALALTMEIEATQRYAEFADAMETHNNREVAALFRKMTEIEAKHARRIMAEMGWREPPAAQSAHSTWDGGEGPESAAADEVHYLMQPYHALEIALANEKRAERLFAELARTATVASIRKAARALQAEERAHVALVEAWLAKVPEPLPDWAEDPDPPRNTD